MLKKIVIIAVVIILCLIAAGRFIPIKETKGLKATLSQICFVIKPNSFNYMNYRVVFGGISSFDNEKALLTPYSTGPNCSEQPTELRLYLL